MTHDQEVLDYLIKIDKTQDRLIERLFGSLDAENPEARFPKLEARVESLEKEERPAHTNSRGWHFLTAIISGVLSFLASHFTKHN